MLMSLSEPALYVSWTPPCLLSPSCKHLRSSVRSFLQQSLVLWTLPVAGEDAFVHDDDEKWADSVKPRGGQFQEEPVAVASLGRGCCCCCSSIRRRPAAELPPPPPPLELCHHRLCGAQTNGSLRVLPRMRNRSDVRRRRRWRKWKGAKHLESTRELWTARETWYFVKTCFWTYTYLETCTWHKRRLMEYYFWVISLCVLFKKVPTRHCLHCFSLTSFKTVSLVQNVTKELTKHNWDLWNCNFNK